MSKTKSYTQLKADLARIAEQEAAIKKQIADAEKIHGFVFCLPQCGHQQSRENCDNCNRHKEFHQRERFFSVHFLLLIHVSRPCCVFSQ